MVIDIECKKSNPFIKYTFIRKICRQYTDKKKSYTETQLSLYRVILLCSESIKAS